MSVAELGNCWLSDELFGRRGNASLFCSSSYLLVRYAGAVRVGGRPITRAKRPRLGFFYFEGTVCGGLNSGTFSLPWLFSLSSSCLAVASLVQSSVSVSWRSLPDGFYSF